MTWRHAVRAAERARIPAVTCGLTVPAASGPAGSAPAGLVAGDHVVRRPEEDEEGADGWLAEAHRKRTAGRLERAMRSVTER
jgi:hypothetical protein